MIKKFPTMLAIALVISMSGVAYVSADDNETEKRTNQDAGMSIVQVDDELLTLDVETGQKVEV